MAEASPSSPDAGQDAARATAPDDQPLLTLRRLAVLALTAILLVGLVFFVADNFVLVQIRVFTLRIQARLAWALIVPLVGGMMLGWFAHGLWRRMRRGA
ncbi:MAG: hypothetical protein WBA46_15565 [Thermomicrobiales bacterium]